VREDLELLHAWRDGDAPAGNELFRRHFRRVYRFFRTKVDDGIDDLIQRTFLGCIEAVERFRGDASFKTFLLAIARNQLLLHFRDRARRQQREPGEASISQLAGTGSPSTVALRHEEQSILLAALRELPLDLQITIELFYWEQLGVAEIGEVLGIPAGTVKSRLSRARDSLRRAIEQADAGRDEKSRTLHDLDRWAASLREALDEEHQGG
jgi:RNA polymerase sigma-70 factor (ECF subfamily)